jgi:hypothetical protein
MSALLSSLQVKKNAWHGNSGFLLIIYIDYAIILHYYPTHTKNMMYLAFFTPLSHNNY